MESISITVPVNFNVAPVINSPLDYNYPGDFPFSYIITALNSPTTYGAIGLPSGLTVDASNGLISGVPTPAGTYYITLSATNAVGTGTQSLTLTVS